MPSPQPTLSTERLILRPFTMEDAGRVEELAGDPEVARYTANIPHPYPVGSATKWIAVHILHYLEQEAVIFAIQEKEGPLLGAIQLTLELEHGRAEMGYWIGRPFWGKGYGSEAARSVLDYGFREWALHRIYASYVSANLASGRIMQKLGMTREGVLREHTLRDDFHSDLVHYGILRNEWK